MSERREESCGDRTLHEAHDFDAVEFPFGGIVPAHCPGLREQFWRVTGFSEWSRVRDEIIPALRSQLPGAIIEGDERVVYSAYPGAEWNGAILTIMGLELGTMRMVEDRLRWAGLGFEWRVTRDYFRGFDDYVEMRNVTDAERDRIAEHRASR